MRPPILFLTVAFGVGLYAGLDLSTARGALYAVAPVLGAALWLARRAPPGAAVGVMGVAGALWGTAAGRERGAACAGRGGRGTGGGGRGARGAVGGLFGAGAPQGRGGDGDGVAGR